MYSRSECEVMISFSVAMGTILCEVNSLCQVRKYTVFKSIVRLGAHQKTVKEWVNNFVIYGTRVFWETATEQIKCKPVQLLYGIRISNPRVNICKNQGDSNWRWGLSLPSNNKNLKVFCNI